mmetsp:Transcript_31908/g.46388  ORF Transcript_31908/g.46388 Transcript_31908/m.46388 type:complete len:85 (+) Transcript_31908:207-461(+)
MIGVFFDCRFDHVCIVRRSFRHNVNLAEVHAATGLLSRLPITTDDIPYVRAILMEAQELAVACNRAALEKSFTLFDSYNKYDTN